MIEDSLYQPFLCNTDFWIDNPEPSDFLLLLNHEIYHYFNFPNLESENSTVSPVLSIG